MSQNFKQMNCPIDHQKQEKKMKTKICHSDNSPFKNYVTIKYEHPYYGSTSMEVFVPVNGGYVRFSNGGQVCEGLNSTGQTLYFRPSVSGDNFINYIRAQWRKYKQQLDREASHD